MGDESVRWTVVVDKQTDIDLRMLLAERGTKKGDLSKFIENAVKRQFFARSWAEFSESFADLSDDERSTLADEAVSWARSGS